MSLINEALKKAQRLRTEDAADPTSSYPASGTGAARRGKPEGANTMVLIGSGALVLVVLSVFFTVYLINRPSTPASAAVASAAPVVKPPTVAPAVSETVAPAIVVPKIGAPQPASAPGETSLAATPAVAVATPPTSSVAASSTPLVTVAIPVAAPQPAPTTPANVTPLPASPTATHAAAAAPTPELAPNTPDERVAAFVESVRVTGIRSSGAESRVLMNERVYRVNDIVERTMNVRLIKAAADSLTFSDPRGVTYVKRF
jgi:hypothetical protein